MYVFCRNKNQRKCFSAQLTGLSISSTGYSQIRAYKMCFCLVQHDIFGNTFSLRFPAEFTLRRTKADYIHNTNTASHKNVHALQINYHGSANSYYTYFYYDVETWYPCINILIN